MVRPENLMIRTCARGRRWAGRSAAARTTPPWTGTAGWRTGAGSTRAGPAAHSQTTGPQRDMKQPNKHCVTGPLTNHTILLIPGHYTAGRVMWITGLRLPHCSGKEEIKLQLRTSRVIVMVLKLWLTGRWQSGGVQATEYVPIGFL